MNTEAQTALRIRQLLDESCSRIDPSIATRLARGREAALSRQKVSRLSLSLSGFGSHTLESVPQRARGFAAVAALVLGMAGAYYWNEFQTADENVDVDSALLADELPIDAYTDQGFGAWVEHSLHSQQ